ncbi:hypothetical protein DFH06DRAFT_1343431 [Mycena polygramma]|nr:hypothetical protein DFH06DRAFT_1343431 [Mycena polygramma]
MRTTITDTELLKALAEIPSLETLVVWDSDTDCRLITDTLLQGMTWDPASSSSLVPKLKYLKFWSNRRFSDEAFLNFVTSRADPAYNVENKPFTAELRFRFSGCLWFGCLPLAPETRARLEDLVSQGGVKFTLLDRTLNR